ncbi:MAG: metal-sensitive transcriptional regulator [Betaproteobacteria bacterium]|nr:metal-sensitive transcriptional regulator [Betaproteobacteria bacterium]MDE2624379.1 metal-sensitive transcriptional regulator [Betaproteobacteria bacterium]
MTSRPDPRERCHGSEKTVVQPHKQALLNRLNRIAGQIRGISGMVEGDRYCIDILTQVRAVRSALDAVALQLIEDHTKGCVQKAVQQGNGEAALSELMGVLKKISR